MIKHIIVARDGSSSIRSFMDADLAFEASQAYIGMGFSVRFSQ